MNILITGCGSGLGQSLLEESAKRDLSVFPHYRNSSSHFSGDICDDGFSDKLGEYIREKNIDVFVNSAAIYCGGPLVETSDSDIEKTIFTNLTSQILMLKKVFSYFVEKKSGLIININSLSGIYPAKNESIYSASKFGLKGFSKSLQLEAIGTGVEVLDVYPGAIQTRMTESRPNYSTLMDSNEVASQILDLISDKKHYVNEVILRKRNESSCT
jgi:short-subunit dehydrogenase